LARQCGGGVHDKGIGGITASPNPGHRPGHLADPERDTAFQTNDESDSWFCYDFNNRTIKLTHYSIRSYGIRHLSGHSKSWVIEGSVNGRLWIELDRRENDTELNGVKPIQTFSVSRSEEIRMIQMR
jgi:hypothetical protein